MNKNILIIILVVIIVALVASFGTYALINSGNDVDKNVSSNNINNTTTVNDSEKSDSSSPNNQNPNSKNSNDDYYYGYGGGGEPYLSKNGPVEGGGYNKDGVYYDSSGRADGPAIGVNW